MREDGWSVKEGSIVDRKREEELISEVLLTDIAVDAMPRGSSVE